MLTTLKNVPDCLPHRLQTRANSQAVHASRQRQLCLQFHKSTSIALQALFRALGIPVAVSSKHRPTPLTVS
jgi:hypothetical protein